MTQQSFLIAVEKDAEQINHYLQANLESHVGLISKIGEHILLGGGKRIRPMLFVLCARLADYGGTSEYYFSTVFEYLHAATLLHDDVIDRAEVRRGTETANVLWGNSAAVLVGDFLYSKSFNMAVEMGNLRVLEVLSNTTNRMAEGMVLELIHSFDFNMRMEDYLEVIISKTAVLMSAACRIGGMLGNITEEQEKLLGDFGMDLGIAFQLVDDALDYSVSQKEFGKPVGKDVEEGKITLPLLRTLEICTPEERRKLIEWCDKDTFKPEHFSSIQTLVRSYNGVEYSLERAKEYKDRARTNLLAFPDIPGRQLLIDLADFVVERRF
ncbi:MAG: polyprenyl synthetase family protein [Deltaproteobacteria bacterium]|nr:polyprenyl synthetase family protein [Deltaproteobacteria bacterium]